MINARCQWSANATNWTSIIFDISPSINRFSPLEPFLLIVCVLRFLSSTSSIQTSTGSIVLGVCRGFLWVEKEKEKNNSSRSNSSSSSTNSETVYRSQLLPIRRFSFFGCLTDDTISVFSTCFSFFDDHYDNISRQNNNDETDANQTYKSVNDVDVVAGFVCDHDERRVTDWKANCEYR